jgi:hypothetical protein
MIFADRFPLYVQLGDAIRSLTEHEDQRLILGEVR